MCAVYPPNEVVIRLTMGAQQEVSVVSLISLRSSRSLNNPLILQADVSSRNCVMELRGREKPEEASRLLAPCLLRRCFSAEADLSR